VEQIQPLETQSIKQTVQKENSSIIAFSA
jgi:hypothetical protein